MAWTTADIPRLDGRTAVVTGANGGLGLETARALARAGAHVVLAARDAQKADAAVATIERTIDGASLEIVPLDLGSMRSIRDAAGTILATHRRLDLLVNNAGLMAIPERRTEDGFEVQFGVNHLGHFALTGLLLPALLSADAARVVTVTSTAHHFGRTVDLANPHLEGHYSPWRAYSQSKLANYQFALGLQRRFAAAGDVAASLLADPGFSNTDLQARSARESGRSSQGFFHALVTRAGMSAAAGALPQLRAATDPQARGGDLYAPRFVSHGPPVRRAVLRRLGLDAAVARLWEVSQRETGVVIDVPGVTAAIRGGGPRAS